VLFSKPDAVWYPNQQRWERILQIEYPVQLPQVSLDVDTVLES